MGGMNALGGPGVWQGGQGGLQNLGQFGALGYPVRPGPAGEEALAHFGQQIPEHLQQTQLFGGLEGKHPLLAKMLEGGIMGAALTPGPEPGRAEGAGQGVSRALQGVLGQRQAERQFQIRQIVAPYELARQTAELQGSAQEQQARKAQINEMNQRANYFGELAKMTAPEAREAAAKLGFQAKDEEIKMLQAKWQQQSQDYENRTTAMATWHEKQYNTALKIGQLRSQAVLGSAKMRLSATQQLSKLANAATAELNAERQNRDALAKDLNTLGNSVDYLKEDPAAVKQFNDLRNKFIAAQTAVEGAEEIDKNFGDALKASATYNYAFDETNPTNPLNIPGGESRGRGTPNPNNPAGLNLPGLPR